MSGWIKLSRDINSHWIWDDPVKFKWWMDILLTVNFSEKKVVIGYKVFDCKKGECLLSLQNWGKRWNVSKTVVNNFFTMLENDNMIETVNETVTTRLRVCNYERYQQIENAKKTQRKRDSTGTVPQQSTTKEGGEVIGEIEENIIITNNIEFREKKFIEDMSVFKDKYTSDVLNSFYRYWSEKTPDGKKMKFELQKTFEISKRLVTWNSNQSKFSNNGTGKPKFTNTANRIDEPAYLQSLAERLCPKQNI